MPDIPQDTGLRKYLPFPSKVISMVTKTVKKSMPQRIKRNSPFFAFINKDIQFHIRNEKWFKGDTFLLV